MQINQLKQIIRFDGASNCNSYSGIRARHEMPMHIPIKFCDKRNLVEVSYLPDRGNENSCSQVLYPTSHMAACPEMWWCCWQLLCWQDWCNSIRKGQHRNLPLHQRELAAGRVEGWVMCAGRPLDWTLVDSIRWWRQGPGLVRELVYEVFKESSGVVNIPVRQYCCQAIRW